MNDFQTELFCNLVYLTITTETFYCTEQELDGLKYKIFNYRLTSYSEFLLPNALNCRGTMFEVDEFGSPIRLASLPMPKFFNKDENPMTMDLDLSKVEDVDYKADGSLISTFMHNNKVRVKSKGSLQSDHALAATKYMRKHTRLEQELEFLTYKGFTVNMEWVSPDPLFRIVLGYDKEDLIILNIRDNSTGNICSKEDFYGYPLEEIFKHWCEKPKVDNIQEFVASIPDMKDIEGFVLKMSNGLWFKMKTKWYLARHHCINSINSPRRLYECVLREATDDMRSLFVDDTTAIKLIEEMEEFVSKTYNHMINLVESFYNENKLLTRKDYAIKGQKDLDRKYFGLAMNLYSGKTNDYKEFMSKNFKYFGINDDE